MVSSIVELDQQYGDRLVVIGVDAAESPDVVRAFVDKQGMTYLNLIGDEEMLQAYRLRGHPYTVLITPEGQVFRSYLGYTDKATVEGSVRALLGLE
jgi:uncharacterized protein YyaL (SSP411 family)